MSPNEIGKPWEKIEGSRAQDFVSFYANNIAVQTNFFDCALIFSEMLGVRPDDSTVLMVEQKARIVLSLAQSKLLAMTLLSQIYAYEQRFKEIDLPPEVIPPELVAFAYIWKKEKSDEG
jgi:hypothetical protein